MWCARTETKMSWPMHRKIIFLIGMCALSMPVHLYAQDQTSPSLYEAVVGSNPTALRQLIESGAAIDEPLPNGNYPIMLAAQYSDIETMKVLTAHKVNVQLTDRFGRTAMHYAAIAGSIEKVKLLRALKVPADIPDGDGVTPLYYAYLNDHLELADYLLENETVQINQTDAQGSLLAFRVVEKGDNPKIIENLIKHDLNIFKKNAQRQLLAEVAAKRGYGESAKLLKDAMESKIKAFQDQSKSDSQ